MEYGIDRALVMAASRPPSRGRVAQKCGRKRHRKGRGCYLQAMIAVASVAARLKEWDVW